VFGYFTHYLLPGLSKVSGELVHSVVLLGPAILIQFIRKFLFENNQIPWLDRIFKTVITSSVLAAILPWFSPFWASTANGILQIANVVVLSTALLMAFANKPQLVKVLMIGWCSYLAGIFWTMLEYIQLIPGNDFSLYCLPLAMVIEALFFSMALAVRINSLQSSNLELQKISDTDALTAIGNRRSFDRALQTAWMKAQQAKQSVALIMLDIDHFKKINDNYGHDVGDACIRYVAQTINTELRHSGDKIYRLGGEEFAVLLPATTQQAAYAIAERLHNVCSPLKLTVEDQDLLITESFGVAACKPATGDQKADLMKRVDRAMYQAKQAGRNRVCQWQEQRDTAISLAG
jgi:diguanylate cyclase (GGDEF)-like protein